VPRMSRLPTQRPRRGVCRLWRFRHYQLPFLRRQRTPVPAELGVRSALVGAPLGPFPSQRSAAVRPASDDECGNGQRASWLPCLAMDLGVHCAVRVASVALNGPASVRDRSVGEGFLGRSADEHLPERAPSASAGYPDRAMPDGGREGVFPQASSWTIMLT
jgi:hypothetical protein